MSSTTTTNSEEKTLANLIGLRPKNGDVGIEIEVEYKNGSPMFLDNIGCWRSTEDGSLKYGVEYVTRNPIKVTAEKFNKIKELTDTLAKYETQITSRCSVHVHRNISSFTPIQIWNTILAYWLLEQPLLAYCGTHRRANLFCLGVREASGVLAYCYKDLNDSSVPFMTFRDEAQYKYGGQNLNAIPRLGSIEYRGMRGTLDPELIDLWSTGMYELGERAKKFKDPAELMDFFLDSEKDQFLQRLLPNELIQEIVKVPSYDGVIKENAMILCDLAYYHDDWQAWEDKIKPVKKRSNEQKLGDIYSDVSLTNALNILTTTSTIDPPAFYNVIDD